MRSNSTSEHINFQIATTARGRGVLRLILYEKRTNLVAIPAMCIQIYIAADASTGRPQMVCVILKLLSIIVATNRSVGEAAVALGRYVHLDLNAWGERRV